MQNQNRKFSIQRQAALVAAITCALATSSGMETLLTNLFGSTGRWWYSCQHDLWIVNPAPPRMGSGLLLFERGGRYHYFVERSA